MQDACLGMYVVEDQAIGDEMAILDPFPLDDPIVRGNQPLAPKEDPPDEAIERLAFVGRGVNRLPEVRVTEIPESERRPDHAPEFPKRQVEAILPAIRA